MKYYPVTVIDNFYDDPDAVRNFALKQNYVFCHQRPDIQHVYPGSRTKDLFDLNGNLHAKICNRLVSVFHNPEHDYMRWGISTSFQSVTAEYGQGVIHTDHDTIFAGVIYLTPDAPLNAGTSLYKRNNRFDEVEYKRCLEENDDRFKAGQKVMSVEYHQMFDEIVRVNNVYNTLIIYEGDMAHSANQFFGDTLKNSRLAQVFFINRIDARKESSFPLSRLKLNKV